MVVTSVTREESSKAQIGYSEHYSLATKADLYLKSVFCANW